MANKEIWHKDHKNQKIIIEKQWDNTPTLERVNQIKSSGVGDGKDYKFAGSIPIGLLKEVCNKLGVNWNDVEARKEVVKKMMLSGDLTSSGCGKVDSNARLQGWKKV